VCILAETQPVPENHFDEKVAADYDTSTAAMFEAAVLDPAVTLLSALAEGGPALEFGTGRVALPLGERGVEIHGIELSHAMAKQLRDKPGGDRIPLTFGDFAHTRVDRSFALVYLVFNTIMNLTHQDQQVACFVNAATHLRPGRRFVVEVMVPDLRGLPPGETVQPFDVNETHIGFDEYTDLTRQQVTSHHHWPTTDRPPMATPLRYVWPSELDLMARLANLELEHRWSDWQGSPFTGDSTAHVSAWRR